jgi:GTP cyclohydrolase II
MVEFFASNTSTLPMSPLTCADLAAVLAPRLTALGYDVHNLPTDEGTLLPLLLKLDNRERDMACDLLALRAGRVAADWPKWVDKVHDEALQCDAIDDARKTLADHLTATLSEIRQARKARRNLQGEGGTVYDAEHEGGQHFDRALDDLEHAAVVALALNPTRAGH